MKTPVFSFKLCKSKFNFVNHYRQPQQLVTCVTVLTYYSFQVVQHGIELQLVRRGIEHWMYIKNLGLIL